jgi:O-antigen ligase
MLVMVLCLLLALALVPPQIQDRLVKLIPAFDAETSKGIRISDTRRVTIVSAAIKLVSENPFMGVGVGNFRWLTAQDGQFGGLAMSAHNAYVLALAEGGLILLAVYLLLFWFTGRELFHTLRLSNHLPGVGLRWLVLATRTNLLLLLTFSVFAEAWKEFFFVLIIATAGMLGQIYRRAAAER